MRLSTFYTMPHQQIGVIISLLLPVLSKGDSFDEKRSNETMPRDSDVAVTKQY
jgi:hypothetical protein